jgi:hypothetical protein
MAQVLYKSTPLPSDHLVKLHQRRFPTPGPSAPSVRLVVFEDMDTIPELLLSHPTNHQYGVDVGTALHANSGPSDMAIVGYTSASHGIDSLGDIPSDSRRAEGLADYDAKDAVDANDGEVPNMTEVAIVIQRAARHHFFKGTEEHSNDPLRIGRQRLFKSCKASADAIHTKYRKLYLGPVPHLLLCVEWIVTRAQDLKNVIKARRAEAALQEKSDLIVQYKQMR